MRRSRKIAVALGALVAVVVLPFAWAVLWPAPEPPLSCRPGDGPACTAASGRVVWIPASDRGDRSRALHLVLVSKDSVALPLITFVKVPVRMRPRENPGYGRWVSVVGTKVKGSQSWPDIHVTRLAMN